jgi:6-pyruvoyltetrahydropterin/6-carboxytetrahydropterin synthase
MFQVSVDEEFSAGHALRGYQGKCENVHGHNYKVRVTLQGPRLDSIGLLCDFTHIKRAIRQIIAGVDHKFLNDQAPFDTVNPSAENLAKYFYEETTRQLPDSAEGARITSITIWETDATSATYWSEEAR